MIGTVLYLWRRECSLFHLPKSSLESVPVVHYLFCHDDWTTYISRCAGHRPSNRLEKSLICESDFHDPYGSLSSSIDWLIDPLIYWSITWLIDLFCSFLLFFRWFISFLIFQHQNHWNIFRLCEPSTVRPFFERPRRRSHRPFLTSRMKMTLRNGSCKAALLSSSTSMQRMSQCSN
jgi:hypothetical protein